MTLNSKNVPSSSKFKPQDPVDPGSYPARLVQVIDLGLQPQSYEKETKDPKNEIYTTYELSDEFMKDEEGEDIADKPRWISESFTLNSLNSDRAKSTQRYYALDPNAEHDGDWSKLLGTPATVVLVSNPSKKDKTKVYNNIAATSTMRAKDAAKLPPLKNPAKFFTLDDPDVDLFLTLPQFIQDKIKSNLEFGGSKLDELLEKAGKGTAKKAQPKNVEPEDDEPEQEDGVNW